MRFYSSIDFIKIFSLFKPRKIAFLNIKKMSLEIKISDKRFTVSCKYEKSLIAYFYTIEKRDFDWEKETWAFKVQKLESFEKTLALEKSQQKILQNSKSKKPI